ncbi:L-threonylcarbamoyladenylate synthase [Methylomicrobium sp. Wu6]|uniref:L-threonylcarbamoyladenylate synthase n=1 Tax=Methylomicrobium sp. Wu6 TaxID=3107928 RepID=UPI002DD6A8C8|nr:L-threonylcarbamoyladenylate synthase [Methylomicrobium sp. Wu6]MEC4747622.1 L-threonylcarbamoyladenylate synthase [Methylomicrobium sp. Wu6]
MKPLLADDAALDLAADLLRRGRLVAFPTETVYGLGADASNAEAVGRIFAAKGRPADHPLIVHITDASCLTDWAETVPETAWLLACHFWPGPLAMILKKKPQVPDAVTGGQPTVGLRVPNHPVALSLLRKFGGGIAAPSANRFCRISPTTARHVEEELGDSVDLILDGGPCEVGVESTIIDLSGARPRQLRPGRITRQQIEALIGVPLAVAAKSDEALDIRAPGLLAVHYAPSTMALLCRADELSATLAELNAQGRRVGLIAYHRPILPLHLEHILHMPEAAHDYAQALYAALREMDNLRFDLIVVEQPPEGDAWQAVNDRLRKATVPASTVFG